MAKSKFLDLDKKPVLTEEEQREKMVEIINKTKQILPDLGRTLTSTATGALSSFFTPPENLFPPLPPIPTLPTVIPDSEKHVTTKKSPVDREREESQFKQQMATLTAIQKGINTLGQRIDSSRLESWKVLRIASFTLIVTVLVGLGVGPLMGFLIFVLIVLVAYFLSLRGVKTL